MTAIELVGRLKRDVDGMRCVEGSRPCRKCRMAARLNELEAIMLEEREGNPRLTDPAASSLSGRPTQVQEKEDDTRVGTMEGYPRQDPTRESS